jgi:hypothetical protein
MGSHLEKAGAHLEKAGDKAKAAYNDSRDYAKKELEKFDKEDDQKKLAVIGGATVVISVLVSVGVFLFKKFKEEQNKRDKIELPDIQVKTKK